MNYLEDASKTSDEIADLLLSIESFKDLDFSSLTPTDFVNELNSRLNVLTENEVKGQRSVEDLRLELKNTKKTLRNLHVSLLTDKLIELEINGSTSQIDFFEQAKDQLVSSIEALTQAIVDVNLQINKVKQEKDVLQNVLQKLTNGNLS